MARNRRRGVRRCAFLSANLHAATAQASSHGGRDACSVKYFCLAVVKFAGGSSLETAALEETARSTQQKCETVCRNSYRTASKLA